MKIEDVSSSVYGSSSIQAGDSGRLGTAESCSNPFAAASDATKNFFTDTEPMLEQDCEHSGGKAVQQSVLLEELDLALLQEGCIINFCSLFFDSPEPFSVFANSNKTQVFSITKSELFKHMPSSPQPLHMSCQNHYFPLRKLCLYKNRRILWGLHRKRKKFVVKINCSVIQSSQWCHRLAGMLNVGEISATLAL